MRMTCDQRSKKTAGWLLIELDEGYLPRVERRWDVDVTCG
jgi:hypothetical protein